jgi:hypothetical protein
MASLFNRPRYSPMDWNAEFARPAPRGDWAVLVDSDPWRIVDDAGAVRLLCDGHATVRSVNGDRLLRLAPDIAGTLVPRTRSGAVDGLVEFAVGSAIGENLNTGMPIGGWGGGPQMNSWLIRELAGLVIARVDPQANGHSIALLPGGPLNTKLIGRRLTRQLATAIGALGPLTYSIIEGSPSHGVGQLRGPAGQLAATDRFTYRPAVQAAGTQRRALGAWTFSVDDNPFPLAWLIAMLRATKTACG